MDNPVEEYIKSLNKAVEKRDRLGKELLKVINDVLPDVILDPADEVGVDTICFDTDNPELLSINDERYITLWKTIVDVFPELEGYVDSPVVLTEEEADKIKERLAVLRKEWLEIPFELVYLNDNKCILYIYHPVRERTSLNWIATRVRREFGLKEDEFSITINGSNIISLFIKLREESMMGKFNKILRVGSYVIRLLRGDI